MIIVEFALAIMIVGLLTMYICLVLDVGIKRTIVLFNCSMLLVALCAFIGYALSHSF